MHPKPVLSPESLPLHDVPQLTQVGLGNDIIRFELKRTQVVGLCLRKFPVQVEDGTEVHQSSRVLREGRGSKHNAIIIKMVRCSGAE